jgi:hypothetical protein
MPKRTRALPPSKTATQIIPEGYDDFLRGLNTRIRQAQVRAATAVNQELVLLYWGIGKEILTRQREDSWEPRSSSVWQRTSAQSSRIDQVLARLYDAFARLAQVPGIGHHREDLADSRYRFWTVYS